MTKRLNLDAMDKLVSGLTADEETVETPIVTKKRGRKASPKKSPERLTSVEFDSTYYAKAQMISTQNKVSVKAILNKALANLIDNYEKKHGVIKISKGGDGDINSLFED